MNGCNTVVNIPGSPGVSAFTFVANNFIIPAIAANAPITVLNSQWMVPGQVVIIAGPANFEVVSVDSPTQFTGTFLGLDGDLAVGSTISLGAEVSPTGRQGNGKNGYAVTTSNFTVPSIGSTVAVAVDNSACFVVGEYVISTGPANFIVTAIGGPTSVTLQFLGNPNDVSPGATVASGSTIASAGELGGNAFTTNTTQFTVPAIGSNVTVNLADARWMVVGQKVVFGGPATFQVVSTDITTTPNTATLTFLGYIGDVVPTTVIASGTGVSPSGTELQSGATVSATLPSPFTIPQTTPGDSGLSLVLPDAGIWSITAFLHIIYSSNYNGYNGENPVTFTLTRTNNTPTNLTSLVTYPSTGTNASSGSRVTWGVFPIQLASYSTVNTDDAIGISASFTQTLGAGDILILGISAEATQIG